MKCVSFSSLDRMKVLVTLLALAAVAAAAEANQLVLVDTAAGSDDEATVEQENDGQAYDPTNVFVATDDWQEVKPGQVVPAGLHVRMNLETGKKEAKLLDRTKEQQESIGNYFFFMFWSKAN